MSGKGKKAIILDTCIALHYTRPDQINWLKEMDASEVEILVLPVVLEELEGHKALDASSKLRSRAGEFTKWINSQIVDDALRAGIRPGVSLVVLDAEPTIDFASNRLTKELADDRLIAHSVEWNSSSQNAPATILTADTGVRMKAMGRKLAVVLWEDNAYRLPLCANMSETASLLQLV